LVGWLIIEGIRDSDKSLSLFFLAYMNKIVDKLLITLRDIMIGLEIVLWSWEKEWEVW
jgi:hypothetical protein